MEGKFNASEITFITIWVGRAWQQLSQDCWWIKDLDINIEGLSGYHIPSANNYRTEEDLFADNSDEEYFTEHEYDSESDSRDEDEDWEWKF